MSHGTRSGKATQMCNCDSDYSVITHVHLETASDDCGYTRYGTGPGPFPRVVSARCPDTHDGICRYRLQAAAVPDTAIIASHDLGGRCGPFADCPYVCESYGQWRTRIDACRHRAMRSAMAAGPIWETGGPALLEAAWFPTAGFEPTGHDGSTIWHRDGFIAMPWRCDVATTSS